MIECKELCAFYGQKQVLQQIFFSLSPGEFVAVVGKNASGKTTLLRALLGTLKHTTGEVLLDDKPISLMRRTEIARKIAYLPQHIENSPLTVYDTVLMGRLPHLTYPRVFRQNDHSIAQHYLRQMGLSPYENTPVSELSGGFRQRCALASALACESEYLFLDEPTTFLDVGSSLDLLLTLRTLSKEGKGVLAVLHDLPLALRFASRLLVLDDFRLVACDTPQALLSCGILEEVFDVRIRCTESDGETVYYIS